MCKHNNRKWLFELAAQKYEYCFLSGVFRFRACSLSYKKRWGEVAGGKSGTGYIKLVIPVSGKKYSIKAHRLAYYLATGEMPDKVINHIDEDRTNNRICNLENVTNRCNISVCTKNKSKSSVYTGVSKNGKSWVANITVNGEVFYLGSFKSEKAASKAYQKALGEIDG